MQLEAALGNGVLFQAIYAVLVLCTMKIDQAHLKCASWFAPGVGPGDQSSFISAFMLNISNVSAEDTCRVQTRKYKFARPVGQSFEEHT